MAVDEALLELAASEGVATLRFYQWAEPTLSLGYFQRLDDRHQHAASRDVPLVRRQSGGGAILHDRELTYSIALPNAHPVARQNEQLYTIVHSSAIDLLTATMSQTARNASAPLALAKSPPSPSNSAPANWQLVRFSRDSKRSPPPEPFLCFQRRANGDVVLLHRPAVAESIPEALPNASASWKVLGSAQRRHRGALLQHGSLLLRRSAAAPELPGLQDLVSVPLEYTELAQQFASAIGDRLALNLHPTKLSRNLRRLAEEIETRKYAHPSWTNRR